MAAVAGLAELTDSFLGGVTPYGSAIDAAPS
jgi:hypothetical protein